MDWDKIHSQLVTDCKAEIKQCDLTKLEGGTRVDKLLKYYLWMAMVVGAEQGLPKDFDKEVIYMDATGLVKDRYKNVYHAAQVLEISVNKIKDIADGVMDSFKYKFKYGKTTS